jgi:hypothetical protein
MLSVTAATVGMATPFTQVIDVLVETTDELTGETTTSPSGTVPVVTASYTDPGVVISTEPGKVTISGLYRSIIVTSWTYIDLNKALVTTNMAPEVGTFTMITQVDSPARLTEDCTYSIDGESFVHTVDLVSYSGIADTLKSLLATVS